MATITPDTLDILTQETIIDVEIDKKSVMIFTDRAIYRVGSYNQYSVYSWHYTGDADVSYSTEYDKSDIDNKIIEGFANEHRSEWIFEEEIEWN